MFFEWIQYHINCIFNKQKCPKKQKKIRIAKDKMSSKNDISYNLNLMIDQTGGIHQKCKSRYFGALCLRPRNFSRNRNITIKPFLFYIQ